MALHLWGSQPFLACGLINKQTQGP